MKFPHVIGMTSVYNYVMSESKRDWKLYPSAEINNYDDATKANIIFSCVPRP